LNPSKPAINQDGFTIVELIAVLVILGLLSSVAIPRFNDLDASSTDRVINSAISELNSRENLAWANLKISVGGYTGDETLQKKIDYDLGSDYRWIGSIGATEGTIEFKGATYTLIRSQSNDDQAGIWSL